VSAGPAADSHVAGFFHGGINVADLDRSLAGALNFYVDDPDGYGIELFQRRP
jgi:catechol-2,3-dioxygenase